ncbi:MAG TPA: tRNA (N(6)-L-threonylcarbamoyladenosine(37)-C(2))-methylthiotransferase MtaB [Candidatus Acidoferrales bacterium]|nr:tRNA (N(6)-L-threonylcarbamoyladenosine(37)-C(2))-methylthiotransferase MtaB [Candidatus Acidoferrales bacterium]
MSTYWLENFGCRATQADAAAIEGQLVGSGLVRVRAASDADVVVLNTCTVTAAADAQAREAIRRVHRENPAARILATGCYAQRAPEELAALPGVAWVVGNSHQRRIGALVGGPPGGTGGEQSFVPLGVLAGAPPMALARTPKILTGDIFEADEVLVAPAAGVAGRTRPVLKIQDGCNNRCAYCVIPFVRGRSRSLAPERVVQEVCALSAAGAREVVLSGINLGAYGRDLAPRVPLRDLLARLVEETPIERLRLSSIEPMDVTLDLVDRVARSGRIAPHFHVPLQSGSDRMLAAMHRWYRAAHYAERILRVAERLPGAAIGADVICGFPGETEEDHRRTLEFVERLPFTYLHVFSYSSRPGTKAAVLAAEVAPAEIRRRSRALRELSARKAAAFRVAQDGSRHRVLTLERTGTGPGGHPWTAALTGNYLHVRVSGRWPSNCWLEVQLSAADGEMRGSVEVARAFSVRAEGTHPRA